MSLCSLELSLLTGLFFVFEWREKRFSFSIRVTVVHVYVTLTKRCFELRTIIDKMIFGNKKVF